MSNHSLGFVLNEKRFSLKVFIFTFVLFDLFFLPYVILYPFLWTVFCIMLAEESGIVIGFFIGLKGQGRYRLALMELEDIALDKRLTIDEREAKLVSNIHHYCLELGHIAHKRNLSYGLDFFKKRNNNHNSPGENSPGEQIQKSNKKKEGGRKFLLWDDVVKKQVGYSLVAIWELAVPIVAALLEGLNLHWAWILFISGAWAIFGAFVYFYLHHVFGIEPKEEAQPGTDPPPP